MWQYFDQEYSLQLAAGQQIEGGLELVEDLALVVATATD